MPCCAAMRASAMRAALGTGRRYLLVWFTRMTCTGQLLSHRVQERQRGSPLAGSMTTRKRPRLRAGSTSRCSGYWTVIFFLGRWLIVCRMALNMPSIRRSPPAGAHAACAGGA